MVSKEEFNKVFKDTSREGILNQFYYEHKKLYEVYENIKEIRECIDEYPALRYSSMDNSNGNRLTGKLIPTDKILEIVVTSNLSFA